MLDQKRRSLADLFGAFGSAFAVAAAVERGSQPKSRDLRNLGIDPEQFGKIGQR